MTFQLPPRVDEEYAIPDHKGLGVQAFNETTVNLNDSVVCSACSPPSTKYRKFVYLTTPFDDALADPTTDAFKAKKLEIEEQVDELFFTGMQQNNSKIPIEKGYYGSFVMSFFKTTDNQMGAGRRRKRGFQENGIGIEIEVAWRKTVEKEDIEEIWEAGTGQHITGYKGDSELAKAVCLVSDFKYDHTKFIHVRNRHKIFFD